jgi:NTE family protein
MASIALNSRVKQYLYLAILILALITLCSNNNVYGQSNVVKNLVFEGAGLRGLAYVGAYKKLMELEKLNDLEKVGGTSAGAIMALCISLGCSPTEVEEIIQGLKIQKFNDGKFFVVGGLCRLKKKFGYYKGNTFLQWVSGLIESKTGNGNITFRELYESGFKDLYVVGTSLNNQKSVVFSKETYPNMRVCDAVRISMSVPLYFEPIVIDSIGNKFKSLTECKSCDLMVDGGLMQNFPIHIFDSVIITNGLPAYVANENTLGLRIDANEQVQEDKSNKRLVPYTINNLQNYFSAFYTLELELGSRNILTTEDWKRTISIGDEGFSPRVKKTSLAQKNKLIISGARAVVEYFQNK